MRRDDGHPKLDITAFVGKLLEQDDVDALMGSRRLGRGERKLHTVVVDTGESPLEDDEFEE